MVEAAVRTHHTRLRAFGYRLEVVWRLPSAVRYLERPCAFVVGFALGDLLRTVL